MHRALNPGKPVHPVLHVILDLWSQFGLMQAEIIHRPNAEDARARVPGADAIHERAARGTEIVGHGVARLNGLGLRKSLEVVAPAHVLEVGVVHHEVRREHGGRDLSAVCAIAHEGPQETGAVSGLVVGFIWLAISLRGNVEVSWVPAYPRYLGMYVVLTYPRVARDQEDSQMRVARHRRSMWPSLHPRLTSRRRHRQPGENMILTRRKPSL